MSIFDTYFSRKFNNPREALAYFGSDVYDKFIESGRPNADLYPKFISRGADFHILNYGSDTLTESYGTEISKINSLPEEAMKNLVLIKSKEGRRPVPIAGSYFVKLLLAEPGVVEPNLAIIAGNDGALTSLTINGNLNLNGSEDALTAINTLGKTNTIDCGYYEEA